MQIDDLHKKISIKQNSNNGIDVHYNGQHVLHVMPAGGGYVWSPVQSFFATHIGSTTNMPYQQTAAHDEVHTAIADGLAALFDVGLFDAVSGIEVPEDSYADVDCCAESTKMEKTKRLLEFLKESKKKSDRIKNDPCWKGYKMVGMKNKGDKEVPNCVPESVEQIEELTDKQKKIDLNKNGKVDGEDLSKLRNMKKESVERVDEAVTVDKKTYNWGKMVTVHHGNKDSYPLHPEHQEAIKNLKDGDKTKFKDETKRIVTAHRIGNSVLLSHPQSNKATSVAHSHFTESLELSEKLSDKASPKDYIEDFIKSDAPQFKGKTKAERIKMALGAFYSKNESAMNTILGYTKKKSTTEPKEEPKSIDSDNVVKDDSGLYMDKEYAKKYGFMKEEGDGTGQLLGGVSDTDPTNLVGQIARADYRLTASGRKVKRRITFKAA